MQPFLLVNTAYTMKYAVFSGVDTPYTKQYAAFSLVYTVYTKQYAVFSGGVHTNGYWHILSKTIAVYSQYTNIYTLLGGRLQR